MVYKITIIDDDKYNQMQFNYDKDICKLIESKYGNLVKYLKNVVQSDLSDMVSSDIIMMHDSYPDTEIKENIYNICKDKGIHLIKFSNGITATFKSQLSQSIKLEIKKDRVYSNLEYFLDDYLGNGFVADFEKLINGFNYRVVKAILIRENLSKSLLIGYGKKIDTLIPENSEDEKKLKELFYLAYGGSYEKHFDELIESLNTGYEEVITICHYLVSLIKPKS